MLRVCISSIDFSDLPACNIYVSYFVMVYGSYRQRCMGVQITRLQFINIRLVFCDVQDPAGILLKKVKVTTSQPYSGEECGSQWRID